MEWFYRLVNKYGQKDAKTIKELRATLAASRKEVAKLNDELETLKAQTKKQNELISNYRRKVSVYGELYAELKSFLSSKNGVSDKEFVVNKEPTLRDYLPKDLLVDDPKRMLRDSNVLVIKQKQNNRGASAMKPVIDGELSTGKNVDNGLRGASAMRPNID